MTIADAYFNPLYTGRLFHCYILDEAICHFRGVGSILLLLFYLWWKILLGTVCTLIRRHIMWRLNRVCTVCLWPFLRFPGKNGLNVVRVGWNITVHNNEQWTMKFEIKMNYELWNIFTLFIFKLTIKTVCCILGFLYCSFIQSKTIPNVKFTSLQMTTKIFWLTTAHLLVTPAVFNR